MGANRIELEYKFGREEITAFRDFIGWSMGCLDPKSEEASDLRDHFNELYISMKATVQVNNINLPIVASMYESFEGNVFRLIVGTS